MALPQFGDMNGLGTMGGRGIVEVSGQLGHTTPTERARDAQHRNGLQDLGFTVYEFTSEQVTRRTGWVQPTDARRLTTAGRRADPVLVTESP